MSFVSKEDFIRYEALRKSGKYNMITDCSAVMNELNVTIGTYIEIISNYDKYYKEYLREKE